jgi:crossover junction endodeoxyribonuclease RuvC
VDPGTLRLGFGVLDDNSGSPRCLEWGCLTAERGWPVHQRLHRLHQELRAVVERWAPEQLAVEEPFVNVERGAKSAVAVGQAQAVALLLAAEAGLEVYRYSPTQIKRTVGDYGAATKGQVQRVLQMLLGLEPVPMSEDASDALAVALCHLRHWTVGQRVRPA